MTGGRVWEAAGVLEKCLRLEKPETILELGAGTGKLAIALARGQKGTKVIATDLRERLANMKHNVGMNQMHHAVRCLEWEWGSGVPSLPWETIALCVASDVVYYDQPHTALANALRVVADRAIPIRLMLRIRQPYGDGDALTFAPSADGAGSAVSRFVELELPRAGLRAIPEAIPEELNADGSFRFVEVVLDPDAGERINDPQKNVEMRNESETACSETEYDVEEMYKNLFD
jgi:SAM-dependent methyltransferase